ncbi:hypothetical protein CLV51_104125 [Chitinophaga niastensis]|uniref:Uncharacterized protein n=1 Tax=Chitinophaga niastensis TaxID=536980 RepID=A0A2P8HGT5_CHINA|nr:hypothetical protein CLV51_104125 [Chitinophaga niastensis]
MQPPKNKQIFKFAYFTLKPIHNNLKKITNQILE